MALHAVDIYDAETLLAHIFLFRRYTCGENGFIECRDPLSGNTDTFVTAEPDGCLTDVVSFLGDGYCDHLILNKNDCDWDRGDCCEDTCVSGTFECGFVGASRVFVLDGCHSYERCDEVVAADARWLPCLLQAAPRVSWMVLPVSPANVLARIGS